MSLESNNDGNANNRNENRRPFRQGERRRPVDGERRPPRRPVNGERRPADGERRRPVSETRRPVERRHAPVEGERRRPVEGEHRPSRRPVNSVPRPAEGERRRPVERREPARRPVERRAPAPNGERRRPVSETRRPVERRVPVEGERRRPRPVEGERRRPANRRNERRDVPSRPTRSKRRSSYVVEDGFKIDPKTGIKYKVLPRVTKEMAEGIRVVNRKDGEDGLDFEVNEDVREIFKSESDSNSLNEDADLFIPHLRVKANLNLTDKERAALANKRRSEEELYRRMKEENGIHDN